MKSAVKYQFGCQENKYEYPSWMCLESSQCGWDSFSLSKYVDYSWDHITPSVPNQYSSSASWSVPGITLSKQLDRPADSSGHSNFNQLQNTRCSVPGSRPDGTGIGVVRKCLRIGVASSLTTLLHLTTGTWIQMSPFDYHSNWSLLPSESDLRCKFYRLEYDESRDCWR